MSSIAPTVQSFFTDRLARQRQASPHTITAYRDTLRLLFAFLERRTGKPPASLDWADLDHAAVGAFLEHLETERGNSARTRNARFGAIRSLFTYASLLHPEHADLIVRVLAMPSKQFDKATVSYLTPAEVDALLSAPDRDTWAGRRDYVWLVLVLQTGLRVSELIGLNRADVVTTSGAHVRCHGKGRKDRAVPLTKQTALILKHWMAACPGNPGEPLFTTRTGRRLSRDAIAQRLAFHAASASAKCRTLATRRISPHVLRHTTAMTLLHAGVDATVIALWLGHADPRSTNAYLHADMTIKERALAQTNPIGTPAGRFTPPDKLLAFLESL